MLIEVFRIYTVPLEEPEEAGGQRRNRGRGSYCTSTHREKERNRALVRCGVTVRCSALWERVEVQWCCHGDKLRRSVLEVGVTECKSAYPTSTLIFTARATRQHLTRSRCLRATPTLSWQRGEARACKGRCFREAESGSGISSRGGQD